MIFFSETYFELIITRGIITCFKLSAGGTVLDIEDEPTVKKLFLHANLSESTKQGYLTALRHYIAYTNLTPTQMVEEALEEEKLGLIMPERAIFTYLPEFREYLKGVSNQNTGQPLAFSTISNYVNKIRTFYSYFEIQTPSQPKNANKMNIAQKNNLKRPSKELIQRVLDEANHRDRAIMLTELSSGMSTAEIISLTLEQFEQGYDPETGITTFDMRRGKVGRDFITFISPEASNAILKYLEWRNRPPSRYEKSKRLEYEKRKTTPNSSLFIKLKIENKYLDTHDEKIRSMNKSTIGPMYRRIIEQLGIIIPPGEFNILRSHNLRKDFDSHLLNEGMEGDIIEYMMGHRLSGSKSHYYEGDVNKLKKMYAEFVHAVTVMENRDVEHSNEIQKMKEKYEIQKAANQQLVKDKLEIDKIYEELEEHKNHIERLQEQLDSLSKDSKRRDNNKIR
jgi:integrase